MKPYGPAAPVEAATRIRVPTPVEAVPPTTSVPPPTSEPPSASVPPFTSEPFVEVVAASKPDPNAPGASGSAIGPGTTQLTGIPGAFSSARWPGLKAAFEFAEKATLEALTGEYRYLWLEDLGPTVREITDPAIVVQIIHIVTLEQGLWAVRTNKEDFKVSPAGEVSFLGESGRSLEGLRAKLAVHHACMLRLLAAIGMGGVTNPTVRGCTWLVPWPVTMALDERTAIEIEAALVVMPAGAILQRNATLMLQNAWDLGAEDHDRFVTCLQGDPLLISNQQRERWGIGMHLQGRVFWCVEPTESEKKTKSPKKPKPQVPEELLGEPVARVR